MLHCTTLPYRHIVHVWYGSHLSIPGASGFCWPLTHDSIDPSDSQLQPGFRTSSSRISFLLCERYGGATCGYPSNKNSRCCERAHQRAVIPCDPPNPLHRSKAPPRPPNCIHVTAQRFTRAFQIHTAHTHTRRRLSYNSSVAVGGT